MTAQPTTERHELEMLFAHARQLPLLNKDDEQRMEEVVMTLRIGLAEPSSFDPTASRPLPRQLRHHARHPLDLGGDLTQVATRALLVALAQLAQGQVGVSLDQLQGRLELVGYLRRQPARDLGHRRQQGQPALGVGHRLVGDRGGASFE